jgi:DNA-binding transcriptional regulator/RsmH inhibitor MraZ
MAFYDQIARMINKSRAYKRMFFGEAQPITLDNYDTVMVLNDLRKFCGADSSSIRIGSTGNIDPLAMAVAEGRREVWLRIQAQLHLSEQDLERLKEQQDD